MAKDRKKLQHIHSSIPDKQPTPQSLEVGEIAVNNAANQEFLSIKNSDDVVKRFSSDEQIITWMERKEVMPYEGYTRGADGPAGSTGPDSVKRSDLLDNTSNIIIKLNQVAASNTVKHDKVNGAKDIYGKCVNPTTDDGVTDGAGFAIDMSRYAMLDARPSFSALTVTDQTNLQGNTFIENGTGTGKYANTNTGHTLTITTTDVVDTNTNWTETITNKTETITSKTETITSEVENISGRTTTIGNNNEVLHVIGTTTETHDKAVTITNNNNVTETTKGNVIENISGTTTIDRKLAVSENNQNNVTVVTSGNSDVTISGTSKVKVSGSTTADTGGNVTVTTSGKTTETKKDVVTENNLSAKTENTTGVKTENNSNNYVVNTTGNTTFNTTGTTTIQSTGNGSDVIVYAKDDLCETSDDVAAFKGANTTNIGSDCTNANQTKTLNVRANSADTRVTSAYTSATTATTIIGTANTSATTADYSGNTLNSHIKSWTHSGNTLNITESTSTTLKSPATTVSGTTLTVDEGTSISAKTPTAYLSGTTLDVNETNTDITSCGRISANTNDFEVKQCAANGKAIINSDDVDISGKTFDVVETTSATIKAPATTISGTSLTLDEGTSISAKTHSTTISGTNFTLNETNTTINSCGKVEITTDSYSLKQCSDGGTADFEFCDGFNVKSNAVNFEQCSTAGTFTIKEKATTISGTTLDIIEKDEVEIVGDNKVHIGGETVEVACDLFDVDADSNVCIESDDNARFYGANDTEVGVSCTNQLSKNTVINSLSGTVVSSDSDTCIYGRNVNVGGDVRTRIGANCQGTVDSNYVEISANTSITETAPIIELSSSTTNLISNATNIDAISHVCVSAGTVANFYGRNTRIGIECDGSTIATDTTIEGTTVGISGNTTNISGATTLNLSGNTVNVDGSTINIDSSGNACIEANDTLNLGGVNDVKIGYDCAGNPITKDIRIHADKNINIDSTGFTLDSDSIDIIGNTDIDGTTNIKGDTTISGGTITETSTGKTCIQATNTSSGVINIGGNKATNIGADCDGVGYSDNTKIYGTTDVTINSPQTYITGNTNISGDTIIKGDLYVSGTTYGLEDLTTKYGSDVSNSTATTKYNGSEAKTIYIPTTLAQISASHIKDSNPTASTGTITIDKATNISGATTIKNDFTVTDAQNVNIDSDSVNVSGYNYVSLYSFDGMDIEAEGGDIDIKAFYKLKIDSENIRAYITSNASNLKINDNTGNNALVRLALNGNDQALLVSENKLCNDGVYRNFFTLRTNRKDDNQQCINIQTFDTENGGCTCIGGGILQSSNSYTNYLTGDYLNVGFISKRDAIVQGKLWIEDNVTVTGTVTASGAIYSSDKNLKENIVSLKGNKSIFDKVADVDVVSFNFKDDENKNTKYGVIAQDVQKAGLDELVYENNGNLGVDYTSLLMLKIAYLENTIKNLTEKIEKLEK